MLRTAHAEDTTAMTSSTVSKANPTALGFSAGRLDRLHNLAAGYVDNGKLAGTAMLVARRGEIAHFSTCGRRDIESGAPMEPDTIFRIYSMTKPITTVAALILYEDGHFLLDTPVREFIPAFGEVQVCVGMRKEKAILAPPARPVTIKDLMTHTAGLSYGWYHDTPVDGMYRDAKLSEIDGGLAQRVDALAQLPLCFHPGTAWRYSFATDVLGRVIEVCSGRTLDQFFTDHIFAPLGMTDTSFHVPAEKQPRLASLYSAFDSFNFGGVDTDTGDELTLHCLDRADDSTYCRPPQALSGGGGLAGTTLDYLRFCQMLLNGGTLDGNRLLGRKTVDLMLMNHLPADLIPIGVGDEPSYGRGFGLGGSVIVDVAATNIPGSVGAWGWGGAAATHFWIDPAEDLIGIFMTQFMPSNFYPVQVEFRRAVYSALA